MLNALNIENYALIDKLDLGFERGLSIITGETGAGKSIVLGALSLILGGRADGSVLKNKDRNCVVEGTFTIDGYGMEALFDENDLDFESKLSIRRVINTAGKSRAFINDTPVTVNVLKEVGDRLLDIHSQHQNLLLSSSSFQLSAVDALANLGKLMPPYSESYTAFKAVERKLEELTAQSAQSKADYDYLKFQYEQLEKARLLVHEQEEWEAEVKQLSHVEELKAGYERTSALLSGEEVSIINMLKESEHVLRKLSSLMPASQELSKRLDDLLIEIRDIAGEVESINESLQVDPERLAFAENRLSTIYDLQKKHHVSSIEELLTIQAGFEASLHTIDSFDEEADKLKKEKEKHAKEMETIAASITQSRRKAIPEIEKYVTGMLKSLGMPNVVFKVNITSDQYYTPNGCDTVNFLFSANRDMAPQEISKVASGGEMSRLMLSLKSLLVQSIQLPTIIFDEIDTGISGEVADKMGDIIKMLSAKTQIINITHLPQVAAKGSHHYVVYKEDTANATFTRVRKLTDNDRIEEIAKMLSGSKITEAAMEHAKELLK